MTTKSSTERDVKQAAHRTVSVEGLNEYLANYRPPLLAVWAKNDSFFLPAGAAAYQKHNPNAQVHLLETGHFALETHAAEIADRICDFLDHPV